MPLSVFPTCMCVHHMCFWCLEKQEEGIGCPGVCKEGRKSHCVCWHPNPGPLQEQPVLLISEPFFSILSMV